MKLKFLFSVLLIFFAANVAADSIVQFQFNTSASNNTAITSNNIVRSSSVLLQIITDKPTTCRYSTSGGISYNAMSGTFDFDLETIHKKTLTGLTDGVYKHYIRCKDSSGNESPELETTFFAAVPVSAQIVLEGGSPVQAGAVKVTLVTSKILSQTPSLEYSFNGILYNPVPLFGSGTIWTGYIVIPEDLKKEVGSFKFEGRDLEGNIGTEITSGGSFIVNTENPEIVKSIKAEGYDGRIELSWYFEETDEIKNFKIYRSTNPGVSQVDYFKSSETNSFTDTAVERGKTYYYKVSAVNNAGNEGDLSPEVYATALLQQTTASSSGLEPRFLGLVDNVISEVEFTITNAHANKLNFENKNEKEKTIYSDLKLSRDIDSSLTELNSLKKEIENYKKQSLTKEELDSKLNSAKLKLNTIKKKIPENIIIVEEKTEKPEIKENDILETVLRISPELTESSAKKTLKKSLESISEEKFKVQRLGYNLRIVYLDGTTKETSLIKEKIESSLESNENISILEIIPGSVASQIREVEIKNTDYEVIKEDGIVSFDAETKEIIYSTDKHIGLDSLGEIKTLLLHKDVQQPKASLLTGYFAFVGFEKTKDNFGIISGVLITLSLAGYFLYVKKKRIILESLTPIKKKIIEAENRISEGQIEMAKGIYSNISSEYKKLGKKEKSEIYLELESLYSKLNPDQ